MTERSADGVAVGLVEGLRAAADENPATKSDRAMRKLQYPRDASGLPVECLPPRHEAACLANGDSFSPLPRLCTQFAVFNGDYARQHVIGKTLVVYNDADQWHLMLNLRNT